MESSSSSSHYLRSHNLLDKSTHLASTLYRFILVSPFCIQLSYFVAISFFGFLVLKALPMRDGIKRPNNLVMFFMSVSSATVSSMSTVEIEAFSNSQLVLMTILMFICSEFFTSMLGLQFNIIKSKKKSESAQIVVANTSFEVTTKVTDQIELGSLDRASPTAPNIGLAERTQSLRVLGFVLIGYLLVAHVGGITLILMYVSMFPSAREVLKAKGIDLRTFSFFTTASSFANCGFVPTNENMMPFRDCSGLLLIVASLVLCGNTMLPPCLRSAIWLSNKLRGKREFERILKEKGELGYDHLLPNRRCILLASTVVVFVMLQLVLFCTMEWRLEGLEGMSTYRKVVGAVFLSVNSRHAGESIVDLSTLSPAILVTYIIMMYLPPYTSFYPIQDDGGRLPEGPNNGGDQRRRIMWNLTFSQLSYLAIFVVIICITERRQIADDPLNFNVLNIVFEVTSAYGNVGYSVGYSCKRQLKPDLRCKDAWYGFSGRWSNKGKLTLIVVMFFGRLKKFNMSGGQAWILD